MHVRILILKKKTLFVGFWKVPEKFQTSDDRTITTSRYLNAIEE